MECLPRGQMLRGTIEKATGAGEQNALAPSHEKPIRPTPRSSNRMSGASSYLSIQFPAPPACLPTPIAWTPRPSLSPPCSIHRPPARLPAPLLARHARYRMRKRPASLVVETGRANEPTVETTERRNETRNGTRWVAASKRNGARCGKAADEMTPGMR